MATQLYVSPKLIYIPADRLREETPRTLKFRDEQLIPSIKEHGIIQPIVVKVDNSIPGFEFHLIAGFNRLASANVLELDSVPVAINNGEQSTAKELHENIFRLDMTWQEKTCSVYKIYQEAAARAAALDEKFGVREAGHLLGVSHAHVANVIPVAECILSGDAEVIACESFKRAQALLLSRKADAAAQRNATFLIAGQPTPKTTDPVEALLIPGGKHKPRASSLSGVAPLDISNLDLSNPIPANPSSLVQSLSINLASILHHGNSFGSTWELPDESVDAVHTDIPYAIDVANLDMENEAEFKRIEAEHDVDYNRDLVPQFAAWAFRVLKDRSYCAFYYDPWHRPKGSKVSNHDFIRDAFEAVGFTVQPWPFPWIKAGSIRNRAAAKNTAQGMETVMFCSKGDARFTEAFSRGWELADATPERAKYRHPFAKPFSMSKRIIEAITRPGQILADPYAGGGSIVCAGILLGRQVRASELSDLHFPHLAENVKQAYLTATHGRVQFT